MIRGADADNRYRRAFDSDAASEDGGVRVEHSRPRPVPEDGDQRRSGPFFRRLEPPAK